MARRNFALISPFTFTMQKYKPEARLEASIAAFPPDNRTSKLCIILPDISVICTKAVTSEGTSATHKLNCPLLGLGRMEALLATVFLTVVRSSAKAHNCPSSKPLASFIWYKHLLYPCFRDRDKEYPGSRHP